MSLFGDLDVESAEDNPWFKPDGVYECYLHSVKVGATKAGDKMGMTLEYKIASGPKVGRIINEWKWVPTPNQVQGYKSLSPKDGQEKDDEFGEKASQAVSYLKARMKDFGIPSDRINSITSQDLLDLELHLNVTIQNKNGSENVRAVGPFESDELSSPFDS